MKKKDGPTAGQQVRWAVGAFGIAMAYFGAFALLMYPVIEASTHVA